MTTGYLAAGKCWPTASNAIDAYYSTYNPVTTVNAGTYASFPVNVAGIWKFNQTQVNGASVVYNALPTNVYGSCTLDDTNSWDGTYDYAAGAAAWSFGFTIVLGVWMISHNLGAILNAIKRW